MELNSVKQLERARIPRSWLSPCADSLTILHCVLCKLSFSCCIWNGNEGTWWLQHNIVLSERRWPSHALSRNGTEKEVLHRRKQIFWRSLESAHRSRKAPTGQPRGRPGLMAVGSFLLPAGQVPETVLVLSLSLRFCFVCAWWGGGRHQGPEKAQLWLTAMEVIHVPSPRPSESQHTFWDQENAFAWVLPAPPELGVLGGFPWWHQ